MIPVYGGITVLVVVICLFVVVVFSSFLPLFSGKLFCTAKSNRGRGTAGRVGTRVPIKFYVREQRLIFRSRGGRFSSTP